MAQNRMYLGLLNAVTARYTRRQDATSHASCSTVFQKWLMVVYALSKNIAESITKYCKCCWDTFPPYNIAWARGQFASVLQNGMPFPSDAKALWSIPKWKLFLGPRHAYTKYKPPTVPTHAQLLSCMLFSQKLSWVQFTPMSSHNQTSRTSRTSSKALGMSCMSWPLCVQKPCGPHAKSLAHTHCGCHHLWNAKAPNLRASLKVTTSRVSWSRAYGPGVALTWLNDASGPRLKQIPEIN